ncbi:hypothetical protein ACFQJ7_04240 [Halovenus rubra]|uniref:Uncharacterized protein n=2 Tax=Halovenus rubra TaxID=869890 RepID=A0ACC7DWT8_9EURY|nr:hypothetical protein [Halovenus rubra]
MTATEESSDPALSENGSENTETGDSMEAEKSAEDDPSQPDATPQSVALRRQQYAVGVGAALISGFALTISSLQHYPSLPKAMPLLAGLFGAGIVYWLVGHSLYPTEDELSGSE